jgi:hypothetical protein
MAAITEGLGFGKSDANESTTGRDDARTVLYWITLGAAAGGFGGMLVGGVGGRLAMFLLRLTSKDFVRGIESDDGFTIGRFSLDTLQLFGLTAIMGAIVGLIVVAGRPFFPKRGMPFAWGFAGAITGGAILIQKDGVDFSLLEPHALAVALFIAIPAVGAGLICWLTELYARFWWEDWKATGAAGLFLVPAVIFFPVALAALIVGAVWWLVMQVPRWRSFPEWRPARIAALVVFGFIVLLGGVDLADDVQGIL